MSKLTQYPEGLDNDQNLPNISDSDRMNDAGIEHDVQHTLLNQAVIQIQKKLGKNEDPNPESIDFRVAQLEEFGGGHGLEIGESDAALLPGDEGISIPEHPSVWLQVEIGGALYVVPGFEVKTVELTPVENYSYRRAELFSMINYKGEHVVLED